MPPSAHEQPENRGAFASPARGRTRRAPSPTASAVRARKKYPTARASKMPAVMRRRRSDFHVLAVAGGVMPGRVFDQFARRLETGIARRTRNRRHPRRFRAARRLSAPRTRSDAMSENASVVAARNTSSAQHRRRGIAENAGEEIERGHRQILKFTRRYMMKLPTPIQPAGGGERRSWSMSWLQTAAVEIPAPPPG